MVKRRSSALDELMRKAVDDAWDAPEECRGDMRAKQEYFAELDGFAPTSHSDTDHGTDARREGCTMGHSDTQERPCAADD